MRGARDVWNFYCFKGYNSAFDSHLRIVNAHAFKTT